MAIVTRGSAGRIRNAARGIVLSVLAVFGLRRLVLVGRWCARQWLPSLVVGGSVWRRRVRYRNLGVRCTVLGSALVIVGGYHGTRCFSEEQAGPLPELPQALASCTNKPATACHRPAPTATDFAKSQVVPTCAGSAQRSFPWGRIGAGVPQMRGGRGSVAEAPCYCFIKGAVPIVATRTW